MVGFGRTLRVALLGVKVQEARKYHIGVQVLQPGQAPLGVVKQGSSSSDAPRPDQCVRTESSALSSSPEFLARTFVLRLAQPLANTLAPQALLQVNLYAAPSIDSPNAALVAGGQEMDELQGSAVLEVRGDVSARLLRGERVTSLLILGNTLELRNLPGMRSNTFGSGSGGREVLLELMLLDAQLTLPRDRFAACTSYGTGSQGGAVGGLSGEQSLCSLLVLVQRAENLPMVPGEEGLESAPNTFAAAKSVRDANNRLPAQALTQVAHKTCNPQWGQLLTLKYAEDELNTERLLLALVNDDHSRLMLKCSLPLAHILPGLHYNLRLLLPGGPLGSRVSLFVSICLVACPRTALRHHASLTAAPALVEARLAACSRPLHELVLHTSDPTAPHGEVFAVWSIPQTSGSAAPPTSSKPTSSESSLGTSPPAAKSAATTIASIAPAALPTTLYETVDTVSEESVTSVFKRINTAHHHALVTPGGQAAMRVEARRFKGCIIDSLPIQAFNATNDALIWPPDHVVLLPAPSLPAPSLSTAAHPFLQLQLLENEPTGKSPPRLLATVSVPVDRLPPPPHTGATPVLIEDLPLSQSSAPAPSSKKKKAASTRKASATDPGGDAERTSAEYKASSEVEPSRIASDPSTSSVGAAAIELRLWERGTYLAHLRKSCGLGASGEEGGGGVRARMLTGVGMDDPTSAVAWQPGASWGSSNDIAASGTEDGSSGVAGSASLAVLEALVDDCIVKQSALDRIIRQADAAEARGEVASWRVADTENRSKQLAADNDQLRGLLHEEKESSRDPYASLLEGAENMPHDKLVDVTQSTLAAFGKESKAFGDLEASSGRLAA
ncbi:MAG: hypothetical protein WDW38_001752 [Sanguina aurantia]